MFEWREAAGGRALVCVALEPYASHLFTTRAWRLGAAGDGDRAAAWHELAGAMGVDQAHLARAHQVHGATVIARRAGDRPAPPGEALPHADILISDDPSFALAIQTADCVPLLIADRLTGAVAAAHAGWRGLAAGVPGATVAALGREFGCAGEPRRGGGTVDQRRVLRGGRRGSRAVPRGGMSRGRAGALVSRGRATWALAVRRLDRGARSARGRRPERRAHPRRRVVHGRPSRSVLFVSPRRQRRGTDRRGDPPSTRSRVFDSSVVRAFRGLPAGVAQAFRPARHESNRDERWP